MDEPEVFKQPVQRVEAFGRRLAEARMKAGYGSQVALACRMRLHRLTVHRHESQGMLPHRRVLDEYAHVLGVTPQWLLYGTDDPMMDLPVQIREYMLTYRDELRPELYERLLQVPWHAIGGEDLDAFDFLALRALIDRNLAKRDLRGQVVSSYRDVTRPEQLSLRSLDVPPRAPRRTRQAATG
jgi:hypothetical protein